jgi:cytoplasmic iron level regulating protein YaaA (DUF328/UPF0246 family)
MAPGVFSDGEFAYIQEHLRILSGFYGILKPFDGVTPYRLEMQAKLRAGEEKDLYGFWGSSLAETLLAETDYIVNLASKEYSKAIEPWLLKDQKAGSPVKMITCLFESELPDGKRKIKATEAKTARGEMVRFMAGIHAEEPEQIKAFDWSGYHFDEDHSSTDEYVFIRTEIPGKPSRR